MPSLPSPDAKFSPTDAPLTAANNMQNVHPLLPSQNLARIQGFRGVTLSHSPWSSCSGTIFKILQNQILSIYRDGENKKQKQTNKQEQQHKRKIGQQTKKIHPLHPNIQYRGQILSQKFVPLVMLESNVLLEIAKRI